MSNRGTPGPPWPSRRCTARAAMVFANADLQDRSASAETLFMLLVSLVESCVLDVNDFSEPLATEIVQELRIRASLGPSADDVHAETKTVLV